MCFERLWSFLWDLFAVRKIQNDTRRLIWAALHHQTMLQTSFGLTARNKWCKETQTCHCCDFLSTKGNFETIQHDVICHKRQTAWQQPSSSIKWYTVRVYHHSGHVPTLLCHCPRNLHAEETRSGRVKPLRDVRIYLAMQWRAESLRFTACLRPSQTCRDTSVPSLLVLIKINNARLHKVRNPAAPVPDHQWNTAQRLKEIKAKSRYWMREKTVFFVVLLTSLRAK